MKAPRSAQEIFTAAVEKLPPPLRRQVERYWDDFRPHLESLPWDHGGGDWLASLPPVWACSEFVARTCVHHAPVLKDLLETGDLVRPYARGELAGRLKAALDGELDEAALKSRLRRLRRREWLRVAWRDLAGWADLAEILATLSEFADTCVDAAVTRLYAALAGRHGAPGGSNGTAAAPFIVLGLGKLGGQELNFSSDIDLIFAYPAEGDTGAPSSISNHEFFTRLGRQLIAVLGETTPEGFVFRVDMRLRPNGNSGPLALSFDAMEDYYQTHGREWERYALVKARQIAGDRDAGGRLLARLRPFVYRRYLDYGAVQAIRDMKELINRELQRKGIRENIKLGPGGIREVEFIAQTMQLIRGGRVVTLQERRVLPVLDYLGSAGMFPAGAVAVLRDAYVFLRRVEHRLQMAADQQTQTLPHGDLDRLRLAVSLDYPDWPAFESALRRQMGAVHEQFQHLFATPRHPTEPEATQQLADVWLDALDEAAADQVLEGAGYREPGAVRSILSGLRSGGAYGAFSSEGRGRMDRLVPLLLEVTGRSADPDTTLARLVKLLEAIGRRSAYLALLIENPKALTQLVQLAGASPWIANWISQHPVLLDELLDPVTLMAPVSWQALEDELRQWLTRLPATDLEAQMDALREYRHSHVLRVAAADVSGGLGPEQASERLCGIAKTVLRHALGLAFRGLVEKHGAPPGTDERSPGFVVIGYGKLGSFELGYTSDLDLVFLYDDRAQGSATTGPKRIGNEVFFVRLGQRLLHILTIHTPAGVLYEVDMRLRPSGQSGPLAISLGAFRAYQFEHAWIWEHQALVRARAVAGDADLGEAFAKTRREILCRPRDPATLREEVKAMRAKMIAAHGGPGGDRFDLKQDRGGIVDIEFIVQYSVLRWAADCPELTRHTDSIHILEALAGTGLLEGEWTRTLVSAYRRYLSAEHQLKLMERPSLIGPSELVEERKKVAAIWRKIFD